MARAVRIIKIDPEKQLIVQMPMVPSIAGIRAIIKAAANNVGWRKLIADIHGEHLLCASKAEIDPAKPLKEWRIRGGENTAGVGVLFGTLNRAMDAMWHCPVTKAWVERNIVWCEPGEDAPAAEVADPGLDEDPEGAIAAARDRLKLSKSKGGEDGAGKDQ